MGNRATLVFKRGSEKSAMLYVHWDGDTLESMAKDYVKRLIRDGYTGDDKNEMPLGRLEPDMVMINFVVWYVSEDIERSIENRSGYCESNYRLVSKRNEYDGLEYEVDIDEVIAGH